MFIQSLFQWISACNVTRKTNYFKSGYVVMSNNFISFKIGELSILNHSIKGETVIILVWKKRLQICNLSSW